MEEGMVTWKRGGGNVLEVSIDSDDPSRSPLLTATRVGKPAIADTVVFGRCSTVLMPFVSVLFIAVRKLF